MSDGRRPVSGGTKEGRFSRITSIFGESPGAGVCIFGNFGLSSLKTEQRNHKNSITKRNRVRNNSM